MGLLTGERQMEMKNVALIGLGAMGVFLHRGWRNIWGGRISA